MQPTEACKCGHKEVVQVLLDTSERTIEFNARSNSGRTVSMFSCENGHKDVVKLLLDNPERNIDLNVRCYLGWTANMVLV